MRKEKNYYVLGYKGQTGDLYIHGGPMTLEEADAARKDECVKLIEELAECTKESAEKYYDLATEGGYYSVNGTLVEIYGTQESVFVSWADEEIMRLATCKHDNQEV